MRHGHHVGPEPATLHRFSIPLDDGPVSFSAVAWDEGPDAIVAAVRAAPGIIVLLNSRHIILQGVDQVHVGNLVHLDLVSDVRAAVLDRVRHLARWSQPFDYALDVAFTYCEDTRALVTASSLLAAKWATFA
jgi:hypothetical protein